MSISNFRWETRCNQFEWDFNGNHILLKYVFPLGSVIKLKDDSGFAVVFSREEMGKNNAAIINADGKERFRLEMPIKNNPNAEFYEIFYIDDILNVTISCGGFEEACTLDPVTGECINIHITK